MNTATNSPWPNAQVGTARGHETRSPTFGPLAFETRTAVDTACAAYHLNRQPQTLRAWACLQSGPLRPVRVHGRLAWPVAELRRVLGAAA